jgi:CBS domain-containing protein
MNRRVITVSPEMVLRGIADVLMQHRISGVPVVDRDGKSGGDHQ